MNVSFQGRIISFAKPNICPHCHVTNNPHHQWQIETKDTDNTLILITDWACSNDTCNKIFLASYIPEGNSLIFNRFLNGLPKGPEWPRPIEDLKSGNPKNLEHPEQTRFVKTYLQSLVAESNGLDELAGMGYRKSIEYLVKDWAIQNIPEDKDKIEKSWLGAVIHDYYSGDLKEILERATWLGNDQAHYNKLFEEFEITVLKELIALIMVELDRQFKMKHYIDTIQKRK
jgi:hypothetical protein